MVELQDKSIVIQEPRTEQSSGLSENEMEHEEQLSGIQEDLNNMKNKLRYARLKELDQKGKILMLEIELQVQRKLIPEYVKQLKEKETKIEQQEEQIELLKQKLKKQKEKIKKSEIKIVAQESVIPQLVSQLKEELEKLKNNFSQSK